MSPLQWIAAALALAALAIACVPLAVTWIESRQASTVASIEPYAGPVGQTQTAVVYFSRSGNTALAARHVARLNARLVELRARDYDLGLAGWARAMRDARGHAADIVPRTIDLAGINTVYLGAPVWLYSPAPPIWAFVENNRFDGKRVVLFNTFNSQFKPDFIAEFEARVMARGARSFEHLSIRRGRMTDQMTPEAMVHAMDTEWFPTGD